MTIGPVQLLVLGFDRPDFHGEIRAELERLRDDDKVRVVDFLAVYKAPGGEVTVLKESRLDAAEMLEFGATWVPWSGSEPGWAPTRAPRRALSWSPSGTQYSARTHGTRWLTSRRTPRPRSSCSITAGRCRCGTRSSERGG